MNSSIRRLPVPPRALGLALGALAVPVVCEFLFPDLVAERSDLLWVLTLIPAFLLAYHRGWRSISVALAAGMAVLSMTVTVGPLVNVRVGDWPLFLFVLVPYIGLALGAGWFSDVIKERRTALEALHASREHFRTLADASFEAIVIHDNGKVLEANLTFAKLFGYELSDVKGMSVLEFALPEARPALLHHLAAGTEDTLETIGLRRDGTTFIGELRGRDFFHEGRMMRVATGRDITGVRHAEDALRRLGRALDTMTLGVTMTDVSGHIIYANRAEARMHGYALVDELIGQDVGIYAPPGTRQPLVLPNSGKLTGWQRESVNVRKDGTCFPVELRSNVIESGAGDVIGVVTTCEDITARKHGEEALQETSTRLRTSRADLQTVQLQLIEAEKLESVGRLAAGVAHEVKNPLMTILTGVKYLSKQLVVTDERVGVLLQDMADAVTRADAVIRGLLDFAAPRQLDLAPDDLNAIVERSAALVKHELVRGKIAMIKELDTSVPRLPLDRFKIEQVLVNLLTNAVQATPSGGTIIARTYVRPAPPSPGRDPGEPTVFLEVEDTGTGIPAEALGKVFDPFFTTKPTGVGTGLGLSVSRQIIQMHGADIDLRNREQGGVRATIRFKVPEEERTHGQETDPAG